MSENERQIRRAKEAAQQETEGLRLDIIRDVAVHWISMLSLGALFLGTLASYVIVLWHSLAPESMHWLHNDFFLHILRPVILSAAAGSIASLVMWYFFQKQKDKPIN